MHKLIPNHLTYLLPLILLPVTANSVMAETDPAATNQETSITSFQTQRLRDGEIERASNDANEVVAEAIPQQTLPQSSDSPTSHTQGCNTPLSPRQPNSSTCSHTELEQVPRTLQEAGLPNQPIFASPKPISQIPLSQTPATPPDTSTPNLRVSPRIGSSFTTGPGVGYESSYGGVEGFIPLSQKPGQNITFLQGRALLSTEDAHLGGNVVLGYRRYSRQSNRTFGGYVSYDIRDTGSSTFNQVGLGLESLGESIDFRVNGYIPIGDTRQQTEENSFSNSSFTPQAPNFQGNFLAIGSLNQSTQINRRFEAAMGGLDAEVGVKIAQIGETGALRGYGGLYYYDAQGTDGIVGVRGRLEARPTDNFQVGLSLQSDDEFGTNVVFSVATNFPGTRPRGARREDEVVARLGEGVTRQENIVVDQQRESSLANSTTSLVFATNPATNQPYLFQHVDLGVVGGNGTFETPFGIVQNALDATRSDGNDIVYVQPGTNPGIPAFTIPDRVQVLSTGPIQVIPTVELGNVQLPLSGAGVLPTILPSGNSNIPSVTMGNSTVLSGFAINNATDVGIGNEGSAGTGANPISDVTIRDNEIVGSGTDGIRLTSVTGAINLSNNTVTNSGVSGGGDGIRIANREGQANVTITGNNTTGNSNTGIAFLLNNTAQVTPTISGNTISDNGAQGIFISSLLGDPANSAQLNDVRISENTINGNDGDGIFFGLGGNQSANNTTIVGNQIANNTGAGISLPTSGNVQATTTITGNTTSANSRGIILSTLENAQTTTTITGNTISANSTGISFVAGDNAQATMTISGNTIVGNISDATDPSSGLGIVAGTTGNSTLRLLIDSNLINDNQSSGIALQARDNSNIFSTVSNNTLTNNNTNPGAGATAGITGNFNAQSIGDGNSRVCLNLANNTSINPNPAGADFNFFINNNTPAQFLFSASGNSPATINFLLFTDGSPIADPALFTTPLGDCAVP